MPTNFVLPHGMKAFYFITPDNSIDSDAEKTICFLAKKCGWVECLAHQVDISMMHNGIISVELHYDISTKDLK